MKYLARRVDGRALLGDEEGFVPLSAVDPGLCNVRDALPRAAAGTLPALSSGTADRISPNAITFGPPLASFGKLWGIGINYAEHAADLDEARPDEPASFMKPNSALAGPGGPIRLPKASRSERVTAEAELAVLVGRTCRDVSTDSVDDVVAGYLPVIDVTAEDILERNPRFLTRAKSFDTFLVVGSAIAVPDRSIDLSEVSVRTVVDGSVAAENEIRNMTFSPHELVSFHSRVMTLEPGDLFSTGTPGADVISPGNRVRAEVESIGSVEANVT